MNRHACGVEHADELQTRRCEYLTACHDALQQHAARLDRPPSRAQVADLWAHARQHHDDGGEAARWARLVLDLGWRPSVTSKVA